MPSDVSSVAGKSGYNVVQISLHWLIAALLIVSYISSDSMSHLWREMARDPATPVTSGAQLHAWNGIVILLLVALRLIVRLTSGVPADPSAGPSLLNKAADVTHWLIYASLFLIPISGIAVWYFGIEAAGGVHEVLFNLGIALIALHTAAALFHQYVLKDNLIRRMMKPVS